MPAFHERGRIGTVVSEVRQHVSTVLVVDDGSNDGTAEEAEAAGAVVIRHETNRGKGVALRTGFEEARKRGFEAVVTLDADGQHLPSEIPKFIETYRRTNIPVLIGNRMWDTRGMPRIRRWTNRFMSWLLSREMKQFVPDTQCGYRLFRCDVIPFIQAASDRFAAESEILLHVAARHMRIDNVRIATVYGTEKSKINPWTDTFRFFGMLRAHRRRMRKRR
ncbi:MAG: glycosyltransferase family 2 protein [Kiritimatiellae bacterium]|nr:glycosyltransferase family 2 protein [Kiritimatiellia bacterium]